MLTNKYKCDITLSSECDARFLLHPVASVSGLGCGVQVCVAWVVEYKCEWPSLWSTSVSGLGCGAQV